MTCQQSLCNYTDFHNSGESKSYSSSSYKLSGLTGLKLLPHRANASADTTLRKPVQIEHGKGKETKKPKNIYIYTHTHIYISVSGCWPPSKKGNVELLVVQQTPGSTGLVHRWNADLPIHQAAAPRACIEDSPLLELTIPKLQPGRRGEALCPA